MPQLLSPCAATTEARAPRARATKLGEATAMRSPLTTTRESPHAATKTQQQRPNAAKNKFIKEKRIKEKKSNAPIKNAEKVSTHSQ